MDRRGLLRAASLGPVVAVTLVACNALVGFESDYYDATRATSDSGLDGVDGENGGDAGLETSTPLDGSVSNEGGVDGAVNLPPCAKGDVAVVFCDDFDTPRDGGTFGWDRRTLLGGGSLTYEANGGEDGSGALHARNPDGQSVAIWKKIEGGFGGASTLTLTFRLKVASVQDYVVYGALQLDGVAYGLASYTDNACQGSGQGAGTCFDENSPPTAPALHSFAGSITLGMGTWHDVQVSLTKSGASYTGKVIVDGSNVDPDGTTPFTATSPSLVEIGIGAFLGRNDGSPTNANVLVDDVVVRRE